MKIWRKDSTRPIKEKEDKKAKNPELTDISKASTPQKKDNNSSKMEEIYSTKDKQVKYKRLTPLEAEEAAKRREEAKEKLTSGEGEIALTQDNDDTPIVELTYEPEEGTVIAEDIIEDFEPIPKKHKVELQDINEIDIDIDPTSALKKYERQAKETSRHDERQKQKSTSAYEQIFGKPKFYVGSEKVVAKIPTYQHDSKVNCIHLKAGKFTEIVESEYDEYLKSNDSVVSKKRSTSQKEKSHHTKPKISSAVVQSSNTTSSNKKLNNPFKKVKKFFKIVYRLVVPKKVDKANSGKVKESKAARPFDFSENQDSKFVATELSQNFKKLVLKTTLLLCLFIASLALTLMELKMGSAMFGGTKLTPLIYCGVQLLVLLLIGAVSFDEIVNGLKPLKGFRGNSDTALSCAYIACLIQQIVSMFMSGAFVSSEYFLYTSILSLGFTLNSLGRTLMVLRVKSNFKFITAKTPAYCAKVFSDEDTSRKMLSGTTAQSSSIAYQHKTESLSDFLKISYAPDPSEEISGKLSPITLVSSIFVAIVYGIIFKTFVGAVSALSVMSCISIPMVALLAGNVPLLITCKNSLKNNAMISGYPSVKQFSDCNAVMVNAKELYPKNSIRIKTIKHFAEFRVDEAMLSAAVVMKEANSPLYRAFSDILKKNKDSLPKVESVIYEDKLGLVGWINGERVLIGNRKLLDRFHIYIEDAADETKYKNSKYDVTYIACSGQLIAMVVTQYKADEKIKRELHKAQKHGLCLVVSTADCNITAERIAEDYEIYARTIKVLNTGFANTVNDVCSKKEQSSRAYLATRGSFVSFMHALTNTASFKQNLTIGLIIEIFGLILGVLLCATMVLYATVSILGVFEMLLYMLFWSIATIVAQLVKKS
ncbi:MAG: hypothetical protein IJ275_05130 [Ruminococcus sp.]|nr:hypothetical protein [Ruminococcus sp.]